MFWRLLFTFVALAMLAGLAGVLAASALVEGGSIRIVAFVPLGIGAAAIVPAWLLALRFVRPLQGLSAGAERIADGEYNYRIAGGVWGESQSLARTFNQMSQRLEAQFQQLEADRQQLRTILGGMIEGVVAVGPGQRVLFANDAAGRMLEFNPQTAVGRPLWEMTRQPRIQELIETMPEGAEPRREVLDWKGPTIRQLAVYVAALPGDPSPGTVLVLHDMTELRRLERVRQEFVANVSHELKTPLAVIKACIETLLDGAVDDPEVRRPFLEQIAEQGERLHALILDLIRLARIESGEAALDCQDVPVHLAVADCLDRHQTRAEAKRLLLETDASGSPPSLSVWADEEALSQILDNLVDNAIKYVPEGGRIRVRWEEHGPHVNLQVEDNGPGISERDLPRIFERFYRGDKARSRERGGTGLGLAIVKHLAQVMNGSVKAASRVGQGTIFTVTLPKPP